MCIGSSALIAVYTVQIYVLREISDILLASLSIPYGHSPPLWAFDTLYTILYQNMNTLHFVQL